MPMTEADERLVREVRERVAEEEAAWERIRQINRELEQEDSISAAEELWREYAELSKRANELHVRNLGGCDDDRDALLRIIERLAAENAALTQRLERPF